MTIPSGLMTLLLVIAGILPIGLLLQVTNWVHSRFRNRLWNLRDNLVDDLLTGDIPFSAASVRLLSLIETHIRNSKRHTFTDVLLALAATKNKTLPSVREEISNESGAGTAALLRYYDEFRMTNFRHLLTSSPSGWLAWCFLSARRVAARLLPRKLAANPPLRRQVVRAELTAVPEMTPPPESPVRRGPLLEESAMVA